MSEITTKSSSVKEKTYNLTHDLIHYRLLYHSFNEPLDMSSISANTYFNLHISKDDKTVSIYLVTGNDTNGKLSIYNFIEYTRETHKFKFIEDEDVINYSDVQLTRVEFSSIWGAIVQSVNFGNDNEFTLNQYLLFTQRFCDSFNIKNALILKDFFPYYVRLNEDENNQIIFSMGKITEIKTGEIGSTEIVYGTVGTNIIKENELHTPDNVTFTEGGINVVMDQHLSVIKNYDVFKKQSFKFLIYENYPHESKEEEKKKKKKEKKKEEIKIVKQSESKTNFISIPRHRNKLHYAKLVSPYGKRRAEVVITTTDSDNKIIGRAQKISYVHEQIIDGNKIWIINYLNKNIKIVYYDIIYDDNEEIISFLRRQGKAFILDDWNDINIKINILKNDKVYQNFDISASIKEGTNIYGDSEVKIQIEQYKNTRNFWYIKHIILNDNGSGSDTSPIFNY